MALRDPVDKNMLRMEARRFAGRCEAQILSIERADSLREVGRLASLISLPYSLNADDMSRDALRMVQTRAEDRARELIQEQLHNLERAEGAKRDNLKRAILDSWSNLTGPLGHLRSWAQTRLVQVEHESGDSGGS